MAFLYVTEQGAYIKKKQSHIHVVKDEQIIADMAIKEIETLVVFGGVHPTTDALLALLGQGSDISFMTMNGHFKGRMVSASGKNSLLRCRQYEQLRDPEKRLRMARAYVAAKIQNGYDVLYDYQRNEANPFEFVERDGLKNLLEKIVRHDGDMPSLRGYEGAAAKQYFGGFGRCLMHGRTFPGRIFRPSTDPVNALLSFGYSFVARELQAILEATGLDPYLGFFHEVTYGRASLSLDLMEEFRHPFVDRLILKLFNRHHLKDEDFEKDSDTGQVYLKKESLKIFIRHYEEWANSINRTWENDREMSWRSIFWKQAEKLRKCIENGTDYTPFSWKTALENPTEPVEQSLLRKGAAKTDSTEPLQGGFSDDRAGFGKD
ncbi:MAG: CRISPR-associated endonuclease Cas1 [Chitinivibrionales bacterium]|nr:CRISPR-associated endonuclease Cas1 [Chitinivibrionales bacterium]